MQRRPLSILAGLVLSLLREIALPIGLLIGFPALTGATWSLVLLYFPDLGYWLVVLCVVLLATGTLRLALARTRLMELRQLRRQRSRPQPEHNHRSV